MSDDPTIPKVPLRPADKRPPQKRPPADRKSPPSQESKFVGYLVLGFGVLAVVAVGLIALGQKNDGPKPAPVVATQTIRPDVPQAVNEPKQNESSQSLRARVAKDLSNYLNPDPANTARKPDEPKKDLYFKRQPSITPANITGAWQTQIGKYTAVLEIGGGKYQLILADPQNYGRRFYSSGTYANMEDIFTFAPHLDWAPPLSSPGQEIEYNQLTSGKFPVIAAVQSSQMLWQNPPKSETRIPVPYSLSILIDGNQDYLVWQRIK